MYTIYKTTNLVNQKTYIGVHKTTNPNDSYMGSGTAIKNAIKKYGKDNFHKEILFIFETPEEAFAKEKELVNDTYINTDKNYNETIGGRGGWHHVHNEQVQKKAVENLKAFYQTDKGFETRKRISEANKGKIPHNKGIPCITTEETKIKISEYQKSVMSITDGNITKKIKKDQPIPDGWTKGRTFKSIKDNSKTYEVLSSEGDVIHIIDNLKLWCNINQFSYSNVFRLVDKGIILSSDRMKPEKRYFVGKEIRKKIKS